MESVSCRKCDVKLVIPDFIGKNHRVCPECNHHHYMSAFERLELLVDDGSFESHDDGLYSLDPLDFPDYVEKLERDAAKTGLKSEMLAGIAKVGDYPAAIAIGDVGFIGGTCGSVMGEKVTRCIERATEKKITPDCRLRKRRHANAGGYSRSDADGENSSGMREAFPSGTLLHFRVN